MACDSSTVEGKGSRLLFCGTINSGHIIFMLTVCLTLEAVGGLGNQFCINLHTIAIHIVAVGHRLRVIVLDISGNQIVTGAIAAPGLAVQRGEVTLADGGAFVTDGRHFLIVTVFVLQHEHDFLISRNGVRSAESELACGVLLKSAKVYGLFYHGSAILVNHSGYLV